MTTADILNPHSEAELAKAINLELNWLSGAEADTCSRELLNEHLHKLRGLKEDLRVERFVNAQHRKNDKGVEITHKNARSWHK